MATKKKKPSKNVRVQPEVYERLRKLAFKRRKPMGAIISEALEACEK